MESKPYSYEQTYAHEVPLGALSRPPTTYKRFGHFTSYGWLLESLTLILSVVFFAGAVAILYHMDGRPLDDWSNAVSLNAVISILTTAIGTTLMHGVSESISQHKWLYFKTAPRRLDTFKKIDQASRGASGSIKLIFGTGWNLATLGAILSIARLAFSPLFQQVIQIDQRLVTSAGGDDVTYGFAHDFNRPELQGEGNFAQSVIPQDPQMQAAILQGLFNMTSSNVFSCPGLCSWDQRSVSLGFKTDCVDVTTETRDSQSCTDTEGEGGGNENVCEMKTPNGVTLATREVFTSSGTSYVMNATTPEEDAEDLVPKNFPTLMHLATYQASLDANLAITDSVITQCSLSLTAFEYLNARANGSVFGFNRVKEIDLGGDDFTWEYRAEKEVYQQFFIKASQSKQLPELVVAKDEMRALQTFFQSSSIVSEWIEGGTNKEVGVSAALKSMDVDVAERFDAMAARMTEYLRAGPNSQLAQGNKQESVAFVTVRWYWLAGPGAIELGAIIFVLVTMISNRSSRQVPLWKSSATAVLNCELEESTGTIYARDGDLRGLEKRTAKTLAKLE